MARTYVLAGASKKILQLYLHPQTSAVDLIFASKKEERASQGKEGKKEKSTRGKFNRYL